MKAAEMMGTPLGSFAYHLVVLLAVVAALGMALGEWRHVRDERARRFLLCTLGLILVRVLFVVAALARGGSALRETWLPPLERLTDTVCICLLGWAFAPASRRSLRQGSWTLAFGANLVLAFAAGASLTIAWGRAVAADPSLDFLLSWQAIVWSAWQMALAAAGATAIVQSLRRGSVAPVAALSFVFVGALLQMVLPGAATSFPLWERLANLVAYPLVATGFYQAIVSGVRDQLRQLREISQGSLDQIRNLLVLSEAMHRVSATLDPAAILDSAAEGLARAVDADECAVALPDEAEPGNLRLAAIHNAGRKSRVQATTFPLGYQWAIQQAIRSRTYVTVDDLENAQVRVLFAMLGSSQPGPLLVQPFIVDGDTVGAIVAGNSRSRRSFTASDAKLCQTMADQLAASLRNAQRYRAAQDRVRELHRSQGDKRRGAEPSKAKSRGGSERPASAGAEMDESGESGLLA